MHVQTTRDSSSAGPANGTTTGWTTWPAMSAPVSRDPRPRWPGDYGDSEPDNIDTRHQLQAAPLLRVRQVILTNVGTLEKMEKLELWPPTIRRR